MSHTYAAVTTQPGGPSTGAGWMAAPQANMSKTPVACPPGLEYLTMIDQILAHQVVEMLEAFTGWETNNKYVLKNSMGQQVYYAFEKTDTCMRCCCGSNREFTIHIVNNHNQEVMRIFRPLKMCSGCCWCADARDCAQELQVEAPPGNVIGIVQQTASLCTYDFAIKDPEENVQLRIISPGYYCDCCSDMDFPVGLWRNVFTADESQQVGCVTKQFPGLARQLFTNAQNFGITFPMDLDVKTKATLIGAMFLIDFMVFERANEGG